jgi:DNA ligase D-like protein (predicted 3'-phosphoesterase)
MVLDQYKKRRDFGKTPEPAGKVKKPARGGSIFVVQEHMASHHHFDFRLEMDGVLKSWAIPKEPPTRPGVRRLAIKTEDHPVSYADFEGEIPQGQYGAGTVRIWDKGTFEFESVHEKKMVLILKGSKLEGAYILLMFRPDKDKGLWLFFKRK